MTTVARLLLALALYASSIGAGSAAQAQSVSVAETPVLTAPVSAPAAAEDSSTQVQTVESAYNLLLDRFVHPLNSAELARAAWDQLSKDAAGKAPAPGATPEFTGDRAADLDLLRAAFTAYLEQPGAIPDEFVASHALVRGMVRFADEGHTYFLDPQQYTDYQSWSRGENKYVGIGISVSARGSEPRIVEVYEDTPAQRSGLKPGDAIVAINGQVVAGLPLEEMTGLVRGPAGTSVEMIVRRDDQTLTFSMQRTEIHLQFVKQRVVADDIGYLSL